MPRRKRADDEQMLDILDLHAAGHNPEQIAKILGVATRSVRQRIARVITEDSMVDPDAAAHWKGLKP